jgi:hypothetical protein
MSLLEKQYMSFEKEAISASENVDEDFEIRGYALL